MHYLISDLKYSTKPNCSNTISFSINLFFVVWNLEAFNALLFPSAPKSKVNELAEEVQNLLDHAPTQAATTHAALRGQSKVAEEVQHLLDQVYHAPTQAATTQANHHPAPTQTGRLQVTGCVAAGYTGCCIGGNCKVESGCYCDVKCYYFHNCCDDITASGCYRKCAIHFVCSLSHLFLTVKYISFLCAESPEIFMFIILNV